MYTCETMATDCYLLIAVHVFAFRSAWNLNVNMLHNSKSRDVEDGEREKESNWKR